MRKYLFFITVTAIISPGMASSLWGYTSPSSGIEFKKIKAKQFTRTLGKFYIQFSDPAYDSKDPFKVLQQVRLAKDFYIATTEVSCAQFKKILPDAKLSSAACKSDNLPVTYVSHEMAQKFIKALSQKDGRQYRLPYAVEMEAIGKGGKDRYFFWGNEIDSRYTVTYNKGKSYNAPLPVASKRPDSNGVYDIVGNVWEWTNDADNEFIDFIKRPRYSVSQCKKQNIALIQCFPDDQVITNTQQPVKGEFQQVYGGGFGSSAKDYLDDLIFINKSYSSNNIGFRVAYDTGSNFEFDIPENTPIHEKPNKNDLLEIKKTGDFEFLYDDRGTNATNSLSIWRAKLPAGYVRLGDFAHSSRSKPGTALFIAKEKPRVMARPVDYRLVYKDTGSGGSYQLSIWEPVPPEGFQALGYIAVQGHSKPSLELVRVIHEDFIRKTGTRVLWQNKKTGASQDMSILQSEGFFHSGSFKAIEGYDTSGVSFYEMRMNKILETR